MGQNALHSGSPDSSCMASQETCVPCAVNRCVQRKGHLLFVGTHNPITQVAVWFLPIGVPDGDGLTFLCDETRLTQDRFAEQLKRCYPQCPLRACLALGYC